MVDALSSIQSARLQLETQMAVNAKLLQIIRDQGQVATQLVQAAVEDMQQAIEEMVKSSDQQVDVYV